jgi:hypothetical protein
MKKFIFRERKFHHYSRIRMRKFPKWAPAEDSADRRGQKNREPSEFEESDNDEDSMNESSMAPYDNKS